jgi:aminoglycoside 6'-N-acetyltransferase
MTRIRGARTELRRATEEDAALLQRWHADPEVARYWDGKVYSLADVRRRLARTDVDAYVIEVAGAPVGCIQAWTEGRAGGGLDMFQIPSARGRGHGPDGARSLAAQLVEHGWMRVTTDPYTWNEAAIRAWRRAGFEPVEERPPDEDHTAAWLLMEWRG